MSVSAGWQVSPLSSWAHEPIIACPSDKSLTHRAVLLSGLASGLSRIRRPLLGEDCLATIAAMRAVGVKITQHAFELEVSSPGWDRWPVNEHIQIDCGNSGTTARLLAGVFAATPNLAVELSGDQSLSARPMQRVIEPLRAMGADITCSEHGTLPIHILGRQLRAVHHEVDKASAQVKSALLLAGLNTLGSTTVSLPAGARDHTENLLLSLGAPLKRQVSDERESVAIEGPWRPQANDWLVPGDPSSAAFFAALAVIQASCMRITDVLCNPTRIGFIDVLKRMGVSISFDSGSDQQNFMEAAQDLVISQGTLKGTNIAASEVPTLVDEVPILAVVAAFATGESIFDGLEELRVKESDRLALTVYLLQAAGAACEIRGSALRIKGDLKMARPFHFDCLGDHRLAMAAAVLASRASGPCSIANAESVVVSFPDFFDVLDSLR